MRSRRESGVARARVFSALDDLTDALAQLDKHFEAGIRGNGRCRRCPIGNLVALVARSRPDYDAGSLITSAAAINSPPWRSPLLRPAFSLRLMLGLWPPRLRIWRKRPSARISLPREKGRAGARPQSAGCELLAKSERQGRIRSCRSSPRAAISPFEKSCHANPQTGDSLRNEFRQGVALHPEVSPSRPRLPGDTDGLTALRSDRQGLVSDKISCSSATLSLEPWRCLSLKRLRIRNPSEPSRSPPFSWLSTPARRARLLCLEPAVPVRSAEPFARRAPYRLFTAWLPALLCIRASTP